MNNAIIIDVTPDKCAAYLRACEPTTTKYDVRTVLSRMGITKGIDDAIIVKQLFAPQKDSIPIVKTVDIHNCISLANGDQYTLSGFIKWAQESYSVIQSGKQSRKEPFIHYCRRGKTVLTLNLFRDNTNIYNKPVFENIYTIIPVTSEHIEVHEDNGKLHFTALSDGYISIDFNMRLSLIPPFTVSDDTMVMEGHLYPVAEGFNDLTGKLRELQESFEKDMNLVHQPIEELSYKESSLIPTTVVLRRGKKIQDGVDAEILFKLKDTGSASLDEKGRVNLKDFSCFKEVSKGDVLLKKSIVSPPIDGYTVYGDTLKAKPGKDIPIIIKENVAEKLIENEIIYTAEIDGVYKEDKNSVTVTEELIIEGDAGVKTGNIHYSRDIVIKGSICYGYEINCGGNLRVENDIEDKVTVYCDGNLFVKNGIFGDQTVISVEGNLEAGFIQDSNCHVQGNILIHSSILHSQVTANGEIVVEGNNVDKDKASIIGGSIMTMKGLRTHSLGSIYSKTVINCGYNPEMHKKFLKLHASVKDLDMLIIKVQNSIGFNIRDKHNLKRLSHLPEKERSIIKKKLQKLKELSKKKGVIEKAIQKIKTLTYAENTDELYVQVDNVISPEVTLYMYHDVEKVKTDLMSVRYYLKEGEIKMIDAEWKQS